MKGKKIKPASGHIKKTGFLIISAILVIATIYYFYSVEQAQIRGYNFGNELQTIQNDLKDEQADFYSKVSMWKEASITKDQILEYGHTPVSYTHLTLPTKA